MKFALHFGNNTFPDFAGAAQAQDETFRMIGQRGTGVVALHTGALTQAVMALQACARIGATHSVVFGGFSAQSLRDRIEDTGAVAVLTADQQVRGGKHLPLKSIVDEVWSSPLDPTPIDADHVEVWLHYWPRDKQIGRAHV